MCGWLVWSTGVGEAIANDRTGDSVVCMELRQRGEFKRLVFQLSACLGVGGWTRRPKVFGVVSRVSDAYSVFAILFRALARVLLPYYVRDFLVTDWPD